MERLFNEKSDSRKTPFHYKIYANNISVNIQMQTQNKFLLRYLQPYRNSKSHNLNQIKHYFKYQNLEPRKI